MLCEYKEAFGKPNEGIHKYRLFDIAIVDTIIVVIFGIIISMCIGVPAYIILIVLFFTGILAHRLFCVNTALNKKLFG